MPPTLASIAANPLLGKYVQTPAAPASAVDLETNPILGKYVQTGVDPSTVPDPAPPVENRQAVTEAERATLRNLRPSPESAVKWLTDRGYDARLDETGDVMVRKPGDPTYGRIEPTGFLAGEGVGGKFVELIKDLGPDAVDDYLEGLAIAKGGALGTAGGAALGSAVPGVGTFLGGVGGLAAGGAAASATTEAARAAGREAAGFETEDLGERLKEAGAVGAIGAVGGRALEKGLSLAGRAVGAVGKGAERFAKTARLEDEQASNIVSRRLAESDIKNFEARTVDPFTKRSQAHEAERAAILERGSLAKSRAAAYRRPADAAKLAAQETLKEAESAAALAKVGTAGERGVLKEATATEARARAVLERLRLEGAQQTERELAAVAPEVADLLARGEAVAVSHPARVTTTQTAFTAEPGAAGTINWPVEIIRPDYGITAQALATPAGQKILTLLNKHFPDLAPTQLDADGALVKFGSWAMKERRDQLARFFQQLGPKEFDRRAAGYIQDLAKLTLGDEAAMARLAPDPFLKQLLVKAAKGDRSAEVVEAVSRITQRQITGTVMSPELKAAKAALASARVERLEARAGALEAGLGTTDADVAVERARAALKAAEAKVAHRKRRADVVLSGRRQRADVALAKTRGLRTEKEQIAERKGSLITAKKLAQAKEAEVGAKLEQLAPPGVRGRDAALARDLVRRSFGTVGAGIGLGTAGVPGAIGGAALGITASALAGSSAVRRELARLAGSRGLRVSVSRARRVLQALENRRITNRAALLAALRE